MEKEKRSSMCAIYRCFIGFGLGGGTTTFMNFAGFQKLMEMMMISLEMINGKRLQARLMLSGGLNDGTDLEVQ